MFQLAPELGREAAHDVVYEAALASKARHVQLQQTLGEVLGDPDRVAHLEPADYLGEAVQEALGSVAAWRRSTGG
jgi:adenylosuccinate lyase